MLLKKVVTYHLVPASIGLVLFFLFFRLYPFPAPSLILNARTASGIVYIDGFKNNDLNNQIALSMALGQRVPVLFGSSELTSGHLNGLAHNFFNKQKGGRFLSFGHAGFQTLAMLAVLSANRPLLKTAKLTIILSPGWFEKEYCKGTSLKSFFEYATPNYLLQIEEDTLLDKNTKNYIYDYVARNFDKISKPDPILRLMSHSRQNMVTGLAGTPFRMIEKYQIGLQKTRDPYFVSQQIIIDAVCKSKIPKYVFNDMKVNWDSLISASSEAFKLISDNNSLAVENNYYNEWLRGRRKKRLVAVSREQNQEFHDLEALLGFLKWNDCHPLFVIMPLNKKAHEQVSVLQPIINDIDSVLKKNNFKFMDMYTPNAKNYRDGILEDIMHPFDVGWYQIDKFISDNYYDKN